MVFVASDRNVGQIMVPYRDKLQIYTVLFYHVLYIWTIQRNRVISSGILSATKQRLGNQKKSGLAQGLPQALKI